MKIQKFETFEAEKFHNYYWILVSTIQISWLKAFCRRAIFEQNYLFWHTVSLMEKHLDAVNLQGTPRQASIIWKKYVFHFNVTLTKKLKHLTAINEVKIQMNLKNRYILRISGVGSLCFLMMWSASCSSSSLSSWGLCKELCLERKRSRFDSWSTHPLATF